MTVQDFSSCPSLCCPVPHFLPLSLSAFPPFGSLAKKFKKVVGKETCSETLESTTSLEKEKFPQDYFPEVGFMTHFTDEWELSAEM